MSEIRVFHAYVCNLRGCGEPVFPKRDAASGNYTWIHSLGDRDHFARPIEEGMYRRAMSEAERREGVEARLTEAERLLRAVVDSCVNGPLSTDARALASWWEGFDDFVAFEVMTFLTASPEAPS